jgi:hypothetical protein
VALQAPAPGSLDQGGPAGVAERCQAAPRAGVQLEQDTERGPRRAAVRDRDQRRARRVCAQSPRARTPPPARRPVRRSRRRRAGCRGRPASRPTAAGSARAPARRQPLPAPRSSSRRRGVEQHLDAGGPAQCDAVSAARDRSLLSRTDGGSWRRTRRGVGLRPADVVERGVELALHDAAGVVAVRPCRSRTTRRGAPLRTSPRRAAARGRWRCR